MLGKSNPVLLLLVAAPGSALGEKLRHSIESLRLPLLMVSTCRAARTLIADSLSSTVVLTALTLPDGNWCSLMTYAARSSANATFVLYSDAADEWLWSEAIWRGACDVLIPPFNPDQIVRCIEAASRTLIDHRALAVSTSA